MLHLIVGQAGTGKTTLLRRRLAEAVRQGKRALMLVPEQYSFEAERAVHELLGASLSNQAEVLSFTRLSHFIFREYGGLAGNYVDDPARVMLMSVALQNLRSTLTVYGRQTAGSAFLTTMVDTVRELKHAGISPDRLQEISVSIGEDQLSRKLEELSRIYRTYQELLESRFQDEQDDLMRACRLVREQGAFFQEYAVFLDSFKGFMAGEYQMLEMILAQAQEVYAAFCSDGVYDEQKGMGVFSSVKETMNRLIRIAQNKGTGAAPPEILYENHRFERPELIHVSDFFLRPVVERYGQGSAVQTVEAQNPYEELEFVARTMGKLVREEGLRYRDFAVVARSLEGYLPPMEALFEKYQIPYFLDKRLDVEGQPLAVAVLSALEAVRGEYDSEKILKLAKSPVLAVTPQQAALLENYCYVWNLRGQQWEIPFQNHPDGFQSQFSPEDLERLEEIEQLRQKLILPLSHLKEQVADCDGKGFAQAVYSYLEEIQAAEVLAQYQLQAQSQMEDSYGPAIWDSLMGILDQLAVTMEGVSLSCSRFTELLRLALQSCEFALIPQTLDQVLVGTADRIRPDNPKVVFLIGVNQGIFPARAAAGGVLTDLDRKKLLEEGVEIAETVQQRAVAEKFFAYFAATLASQRLYACYSTSDLTGGGLAPSLMIRQLERMFEGCRRTAGTEDPLEGVVNEQTAFEAFCRTLVQPDQGRVSASLAAFLSHGSPPYASRLEEVSKLRGEAPIVLTDRGVAQRLFGKHILLSPTKVGEYEKCPFLYFCQYALKAKKRRRAELSPIESGSVIHFVLSVLVAKYSPQQLRDLGREGLKKEVEEVLAGYLAERLPQKDKRPARFRYLYSRLTAVITKLVDHLSQELLQSQFQPIAFELPIRREEGVPPMVLELAGGGTVTVEGVVDRVDIFREPKEKGGAKYIRVVDYKSGAKKFSLSDVFYGLNLQMLLYLFSICRNGRGELQNVLPAGVLYMPARPAPVSAGREEPEEAVLEQFGKNFRMNGLVLEDREVIEAMERDAAGVYIPVKANKDGSLSKTSSVASLEQLGRLERHVERLVVEMAESLHGGEIDSRPLKNQEFSPCTYCDYGAVCGREEGSSKEREFLQMDNEEVFAQLEEIKIQRR